MSGREPAMIRPVDVCRALLDALDATEGRRRRRKRNTSADAIGIGMKRELLERALHDDPPPADFEGWLLERCFEQGPGEGAWRAMALDIFQEWRMAEAAPSFRAWLDAGAPSDDKPAGRGGRGGGAERGKGGGGGERGGRRPGLPVLLAAIALGMAGCHGDIEADVEDVPSIEVEEISRAERLGGGVDTAVLGPMRAPPGPDSTIYDRPVSLARPTGAEQWPPPAGTGGDEAARGISPDSAR